MTAAFDDLANQTRVGYTFGANPTGQPVLLMGMPLGTKTGTTMVFFVPKNEEGKDDYNRGFSLKELFVNK